MRKAISICFVSILLGALLLPLFVQGASTIPSRTYYASGEYDGSLWYDSLSTGAEQASESNELPVLGSVTCNTTRWAAQTFIPRIQMTPTYVQLDLAGTLLADAHVDIYATDGSQLPLAPALTSAPISYLEVSAVRSWITCNFTTTVTLNAGTMYALVMYPTAGDNLTVYYSVDAYDRGLGADSFDGGATWGHGVTDGRFILYSVETSYSVVHSNSVGNVSQNIVCSVGQRYNPTTEEQRIDRGALFFDTSDLLTTDNIQSATLQFWVASDNSSTNFNITIVDGSGLNGPLQTSDYYELLLNTESKGSATTVGISTTGYTTITITDLSIISKTGYTKLGLRSSRDISGTVPTDDEYVGIYMGESIYPPILTINYTIGVLGIPDEMNMSQVSVYSGYRQVADELFVWQNTLIYEDLPDIGPTEYFVVQLLASDNSVIGQTVVNDWGYTPLSIYLDNVTATTILPWKSTCSLLLTGSALYGTPSGFTPHRYEVQSNDWRGLVEPWKPPGKSILDGWCKATARWMEKKNGVASETYSTTGPEGQWCFHPYEPAGAMFIEGLPYINSVRPGLFVFSSSSLNPGNPISGAWATGIYSAVWGTYWSTAFLNLAGGWGLAGQWVIGVIWGFVIASLGGLTRQLTGDPNISLVIMFFGAVIGVALGSIAMSIALVITIILWGAFLHNVLLSRT